MTNLIEQYGEALRAWYGNQSNSYKLKLVNRLKAKIDRLSLTDAQALALLREHYSTLHLSPGL